MQILSKRSDRISGVKSQKSFIQTISLKRDIFFLYFMLKTQSRRYCVPFNCSQATLLKYDPNLPEPSKPSLARRIEHLDEIKSDGRYKYHVNGDNTVEIENTHCLDCGRRLVYNGFNNRIIILDRNIGKLHLKHHRKRCPLCGEIKPDYSTLAPKYGNYHENYKRMARQMYLSTIVPAKIRDVFRICFDIKIAHSTIVRWLNEPMEPLRDLVTSTPVPFSGYLGYDEIHLLVGGIRMYQITIVDLHTKFILNAWIVRKISKNVAKEALRECRFEQQPKFIIRGIVKDMTAIFGKLFHKRPYNKIKLQDCKMHVKWNISEYIKAYLGIFRQSTKPVPREWKWLEELYFNVIDSHNEADWHINMIILDSKVEKLPKKKKRHLTNAIRQLHSRKEKILAYNTNHRLDGSNYLVESQNWHFERYRPFKRNMMTIAGAQRVADYCRFEYNLRQFPKIFSNLSEQFDEISYLLANYEYDPKVNGRRISLCARERHYTKWFGEYTQVWNNYFAKI